MRKYVILAAVVTMCVSLQVQANLVGYWEFSETTGTVAANSAASVGDGQLLNFDFDTSAVADRFGNPSGALRFNNAADSYVNVGSSDLFNCYPQITIAAWIKIDASITPLGASELVSKHMRREDLPLGSAHAYTLMVHSNRAVWSYMANEEFPTYQGVQGPAGAVTAEGWHHIAVTHDGTAITTYVDGAYNGSTAMSGLSSMAGADLIFGQTAWWNASRAFAGDVDEIAIWNTGLSDADIADVYLNGVVVPEPATMSLLVLGGLTLLRRRR